LISGFWHGVNWTFLAWGALNALYFIPLLLAGNNRQHLDTIASGRIWPNFRELVQVLSTFSLICLSWVFFRSDSVEHSFSYLARIFQFNVDFFELGATNLVTLIILMPALFAMLILEWRSRLQSYPYEHGKGRKITRWVYYLSTGFAIIVFAGENADQFIYFQF